MRVGIRQPAFDELLDLAKATGDADCRSHRCAHAGMVLPAGEDDRTAVRDVDAEPHPNARLVKIEMQAIPPIADVGRMRKPSFTASAASLPGL